MARSAAASQATRKSFIADTLSLTRTTAAAANCHSGGYTAV